MGIFRKNWYTYIKIFFIMGLMAIIPDIDSFYGVYTSTDPMIGHRGVTHSFLGVAVLACIVVVSISLLSVFIRVFTGYWKYLLKYFHKKVTGEKSEVIILKYVIAPISPKHFFLFLLFAFISGSSHLLCDLPQPPSVWKGIPLFFPMKDGGQFVRNGGWSLIGWYDIKIMWILAGAAALSLPAVIISRFFDLVRVRFIAIPFFVLIILFNGGVLYWIGKYIAGCRYEGELKWNQYQANVIDELPVEIKNITLKGRTIFISIFRQVQGYK